MFNKSFKVTIITNKKPTNCNIEHIANSRHSRLINAADIAYERER